MKLLKLPFMLAIAMLLPMAGTATVYGQFDTDDPNEAESLDLESEQAETPVEKINKQLVGWQEAGLGNNGDRVGNTLRANWVMLNQANGIDGQILGISQPMEVHLLRNGFVVGKSTTNADGTFQMESASEGPYTIVGYTAEAVMAFSFIAVANDGTASNLPMALSSLPITGPENVRLVTKLIQEHSPEVNFRSYGQYDVGETSDDPAQYFGFDGLKNLTANAKPSTCVHNHQVAIMNDGRMVGRVHQMHHQSARPVEVQNTRVMIIQNGQMISESQVDNMGVFEFSGLSEGTYGVVAFGADGMMAIGLDLKSGGPNASALRGETASNESNSHFRTVSHRQEIMDEADNTEEVFVFDATLGSPDSAGWINNYVGEQSYTLAMNEPLPGMNNLGQMPYDYFGGMSGGGDFGFMGGGGGGGFGGGFGSGNLLLPLGIGALIYAGDNNNGNLNAPVILTSPF